MRSLSPATLRPSLWACLLSLAVALLTLPTAPAFGQDPTLTVPEDFSIAASSADGIRLTQNGRNSPSFTFDDPDNTSFRLTVTNLGDNSLGCAAQIGDAARSLGPPNGALIPVGSHPITCTILRTGARGTFTLTVTAFVAPPAPPETNNPPVYTGQTTYTVAEGTLIVAILTATDADAQDTSSITFILLSGDTAAFSLGAFNGVLQFNTEPDFENPADADMNNRYEIVIRINSGLSMRNMNVIQPITIVVTDDDAQPGTPALAPSARVTALSAILPQVARAMTDSVAAAISGRIRQAADGAATATAAGPTFRLGGTATLHDALVATARPGGNATRYDALTAHAPAAASGALDLSLLLNGSSFVLPLNAADNGAANPAALTFWGRGGYRNLEGGDGLNWDGRLASASIGLDGRPRPDVLLGVALAYSDGAFDYDTADTAGEYDITMTSVHPYLGWSLPHGISLWATFGYGEGKIEITPQGETASSVDTDLRSVALGASGQLLSAEGWLNMPGATAVRLKSEASATRIDVNGDATTATAALSVDATRFRLALEGTNERTLASGATVSPSLELGVRYDGGDGETGGGDGETGAGLELGGGVRYANAATGLSVEGKARVLVGRDDYDEWGIQGSLAMRPGTDGQGLSFSLSPGYGGGLQRLWRQGLPADGDDAAADYRARLDARLGYGFSFALNGHDGMLTPYSELTLGATNRYRVGMNWKAGTRFDLTLLGERREPSTAPAEHAVLLKGEVRF